MACLVGEAETNVTWIRVLVLCYFWQMIAVQFPPPDFKIKQETGRDKIFDPLRKRWLVLTPEEWVRQNFVQYLIQVLHYPASLIGMEKEIKVGDRRKRFDIIVCNRNAEPWMLVECKAMEVPLSTTVVDQALLYHQTVQGNYLVITNGVFTQCFMLKPSVKEMEQMPPPEQQFP